MAEFQTTFIPKKPITEERIETRRPVNPLTFLIVIIFLLAVLGSLGLYFYKIYIGKSITDMDISLQKMESAFDETLVGNMQKLDRRINSAKEVLNAHTIASPIFNTLENLTLKTVRYNKFQYSHSDEMPPKITATLSGQASSYRAIAVQAALLGQNTNILNPVFSNLSLDDKGRVLFDLTFSLASKFLSYPESLVTTIPSSQ